jgi:hypothetical protein
MTTITIRLSSYVANFSIFTVLNGDTYAKATQTVANIRTSGRVGVACFY